MAKYEDKFRYNAIRLFDLEKDETRLITDYRSLMPELPHWADGDSKIYMFGKRKIEVFQTGKERRSLKKIVHYRTLFF